jgi:predicted ester cyclase
MTKKLRWAALAAAVAAATTIGLASAGATARAGTATGNHTAQPARGSILSNERVVRSFLQTVLDEHHGNRAASFMTSNVQWSGGTVGTIKGRSNVAGLFAGVVAALPNAHASVKDIFGQGDQVLVRLVVSGTQKGAILGIPASGRNIHWNALDAFILKDGKISAIWAGDDWTAVLYYTGTYKAPWIP